MIPIYMTADDGKDVLKQMLVDKFKIPTNVSSLMGFPYFLYMTYLIIILYAGLKKRNKSLLYI